MEIELAAVHEAGHSVMQWFVGWEPGALQMKVANSDATNVTAECSSPTLESTSTVRKRLLVLFAGNAATLKRWPDSINNWGDWQDILKAIQLHFRRPDVSKWFACDGMKLTDIEANDLLQAATRKTDEMMNNTVIRRAIDKIAAAFVSALGVDGIARLSGDTVIAICEREIGNEFRKSNPWVDWMAGN